MRKTINRNTETNKVGTPNPSFNDGWQHLAERHGSSLLGGLRAIDIYHRPVFTTEREWQEYLQSLHAVMVIGHRNGWTHLQLDGKGLPMSITITGEVRNGR